MIPSNISPDSIHNSITFIDKKGILKERHSSKYSLRFNDKLYPPKYVITIANIIENGE